jgi:hypothetical protein
VLRSSEEDILPKALLCESRPSIAFALRPGSYGSGNLRRVVSIGLNERLGSKPSDLPQRGHAVGVMAACDDRIAQDMHEEIRWW